jgi:hypothetical protein
MARSTFIVTGAGLQVLKSKLFQVGDTNPDAAIKQSYLGTNVWSNLVFPAGTYETLEGDEIEFDEIVFDTVLLTVSQSKNIVTTQIQGRNGSVKEYISDGDYSISIQGMITGEGMDVYPEESVINLLEILKAPVSLKVVSEFLNFFDIDELVVTSYNLPQKVGSRNTQIFQINALSDEPLELRSI